MIDVSGGILVENILLEEDTKRKYIIENTQ